MIDCIELVFLYQVYQMRKLESGDAGGFEQDGKAGGKIIDVGHMGENIVGRNEVCLPAIRSQALCQADAKELLEGLNAFEARGRRSARGWLDAKAGNPPCLDVLKQVAIIGSHFYDAAGGR